MSMSISFFSPPPPPTLTFKPTPSPKLPTLLPKRTFSLFLTKSSENGAEPTVVTAVVEEKLESKKETQLETETTVVAAAVAVEEKLEETKGKEKVTSVVESNGAAVKDEVVKFKDSRWVGGTWDLKQFKKGGKTDWDSVIDAEARRRKWLEDTPESSSNDEPVIFDTAVIPWWSWIKRYHLPEAELLNGRAAMIGFFMAYFVDSLTGVGLVDQMGNFFCKTLLFVAVVGVLLIRKNEDIENVKKLFEETTFYDKQWQATWKEDTPDSKKK